eukprot:COSAG02_NODE_50341_length_321_cov_0.693694_1_plen_25_part_01
MYRVEHQRLEQQHRLQQRRRALSPE